MLCRELLKQSALPDDITLILSLESVGILRKYSSVLDIAISLISNWDYCVLSNIRDFIRAQVGRDTDKNEKRCLCFSH